MVRFPKIGTTLTLIAMSVFATSSAMAQSADRVISLEYQEDYQAAIAYMDAGKFSKAEKKLKSLVKERSLSPFERSTFAAELAAAYFKQGDQDDALELYQQAINAGGLLPAEKLTYDNIIAQLLIAEGKYAQGAQALENWVRQTGQATPKNTEMIMQGWYSAGEFQKALPWAERWFNGATEKSRKHYDVMNYLYAQLGQDAGQLSIINQMVARWPQERALWDNKVALESRAGQDQQAYQTYNQMYQNGLLRSEDDLLKLAKFHEYYKNYGQGAQVLMDGMSQRIIKDNKSNEAYLTQLKTQAGLN